MINDQVTGYDYPTLLSRLQKLRGQVATERLIYEKKIQLVDQRTKDAQLLLQTFQQEIARYELKIQRDRQRLQEVAQNKDNHAFVQAIRHRLALFNAINQQNQPDVDSMSYEQLLALQDQIGYVSKGLKPAQIEQIIEKKVLSSEGQTCMICFQQLSTGQASQLRCKHIYHSECVKTWLESNNCCPTCKHELT